MLAEIVDDYIAKKREAEKRDNSKFRVSDAGRCHLMRYWKRLGIPASDQPDTRTQRVFEVGHVFHRWIQDVIQMKGLLEEMEYRVEDEHMIGHIDAIVHGPEGLILYDFKTVHSRKFHYKRKEGNNGDMHYAIQAYTYSMMVPFPVHDARIAYISKDDLCIEEVSVFKIDNIFDLVRNDWFPLVQAWRKQEEPIPSPMDWECRYCIYKTKCNEEQAEKERAEVEAEARARVAEKAEEAKEMGVFWNAFL
jgi:hypothetical protein